MWDLAPKCFSRGKNEGKNENFSPQLLHLPILISYLCFSQIRGVLFAQSKKSPKQINFI